MPEINIDWLERPHLERVLECEKKTHEFVDPDFDTPQLPDYVHTEQDILQRVRQYRSPSKNIPDTRSFMAYRGDNKTDVVGAMIYELGKESYDIVLFIADPELGDEVRKAMLEFVSKRAANSENRNKVTVSIQDGDYKTLRFFMNSGFTVKPVRARTLTDNHTWNCELEVKEACKKAIDKLVK